MTLGRILRTASLDGAACRSVVLLANASVLFLACSDDGSSAPNGASGGNGVAAQGGSSGAAGAEAVAGSGPSGAIGGSGGSSAAGANGSAGSGSTTGGEPSGFANLGVCGQRGESPVTTDSFEGYEEFYLIGDDGFGEDICVVRFAVARVGEGPPGCEGCAWTHRVEYRTPEVLTDIDGVCASSQLGLDSARIDEIEGSQAAYGFVDEYSGHVSVLMKYDDATGAWGPNGNANWSEETGQLRFDRRDGFCGY